MQLAVTGHEVNPGRAVVLPERLVEATVVTLWTQLSDILESDTEGLELDASAVQECDSVGLGLLTHLEDLGEEQGVSVRISHCPDRVQKLLDHVHSQPKQAPRLERASESLVSVLGRGAHVFIEDVKGLVGFVGRMCWGGLFLITHPRYFRWRDFFEMLDLVGVQAVGLIAILGILFGLIMGFSSAMPLRQFGVEIYVADLVAYAMVRVLGPFVTAVIVAGRSGSAFAAEIGTMKIRNELDALQVMNLDPATFLVAPRVGAATLMTPLLTMVMNVAALLGCGLVILSLGYPSVTYWTHVRDIIGPLDVLVGLVKALVFGWLVGTVGCMRGIQTESGPGAVGIAATRAVVTGIVLLILTEGVFSVLLYALEM